MEPGRKAKVQDRGEVLETVEKMALRDQRVRPRQARDGPLAKEGDRIVKAGLKKIFKNRLENYS